MKDLVLGLDIVGGPAPYILYSCAAVLLLLLVVARRSLRQHASLLLAAGVGAVAGGASVWAVDVSDAVGISLSAVSTVWVVAAFAAVAMALVGVLHRRSRRRVVAIIGIPVFLLAAVVGINADFGIDRTVADFLGITVVHSVQLHGDALDGTSDPAQSLAATWTPPADMPTTGSTGTVDIPNTASGFAARPAGIYLPPAALVKNPPPLPFVVMLMGSPGNPDPTAIAGVLNTMAAAHDGLAPIVIVADQLTAPDVDPLCLDTSNYGKAETYITQDVVNWARANLHILQSRDAWTIAGFSNGGQCAAALGAKHTDVFGNVIDISGEEYAGSEHPADVLAAVFGGDQAAYDATKPITIMSGMRFTDTWGVFTAGSNDPKYTAANGAVYSAALAAGMTATFDSIAGGGHDGIALTGGLTAAFTTLYPRLGLEATP